MPKIQPTIGRRIWFWPDQTDLEVFTQLDPDQALDAGVIFVHPNGTVNLLVTDHIGYTEAMTEVAIAEDGEEACGTGKAQWMPYQAKQAEKQADAADTIEGKFQLAHIELMNAQADHFRAQASALRNGGHAQ